MSGHERPARPLPPELAERVRVYLAAFLSPTATVAAFDEVTADVTFWGDDDPVAVLTSAHRALAGRARISPDVEALVLEEDAGLAVDDIATVLELGPAEVRALLDAAHAELAEVADAASPSATAPPTTPSAEGDGPQAHDPVPPVVVRPDAVDPDPEPESPHGPGVTSDAGGVRTEPPGAPSGERDRPDRSRRRVLAFVVLAALVLAVIVAASLARDRDDAGAADLPSEVSCEGAPGTASQPVSSPSAFNTWSACFFVWTRFHTLASVPSGPTRKVDRMTPTVVLPYSTFSPYAP